ncbi:MAG: thioredoxin domain-containing protein [Acidobacteriaceae bacterium]|nr:thioredoxin domain-containing protein [Acidobacteriaceae bacterium]
MGDAHETRQLNSLAEASSAYLRSAMHQPVEWNEWSEAAFAQAKAEDKPILLDIGAVWCHWCHVMDRESYENPETAGIINEHFVPIKVDRDERPDIDARYQSAVSAISGQGGWPLTAFLTPDGKPYFGGTYFPPADRYGRPGFPRVLLTMAEAFQTRRDEVNESATSVMAAIEHSESFAVKAENPGVELVEKIIVSALKQFDPVHGGFGSQPKFPHPAAIDLLLDAASRKDSSQSEQAKQAALVTLQKMARGGIYDHLAGGFHRYSVDERWRVPHFEKMAYDNSELLKNYVHAFRASGDPEYAEVAKDILRWMKEWLSDRERGSFYASQDADYSLEDDGDYFTWTREEAAAVLSPEELAVASLWYGIGEVGDMHHDPAKNVLHIDHSIEEVAQSSGISVDEANERLASAKTKLLKARLKRPTPYVDKTVYVGWNGMCISACLEAGRLLGLPEVQAFALKSLDRILNEALDRDQRVAHVVSYGDAGAPKAYVPGVLDDYVFLGHAALDAWETTGEISYYTFANSIATDALMRLYDHAGQGFFDTETAVGEQQLGALATRRKPFQDSPTPAGNPVAAALLLRLESLNGREDYAAKARETLEAFAGVVEHFGLYAATYGLALQRLIRQPVQVCVIGSDDAADNLEKAALAGYAVNKSVIRLKRAQLETLPPALADTVLHLPNLKDARSIAVVCSGKGCLPPVQTAEELADVLNQAGL